MAPVITELERPPTKISGRTARLAALALFAATLPLSADPAYAAASIGDYVGKTRAEITRSLERQGYEGPGVRGRWGLS